LVVHEAPSSSIAEAARAIRTNLMFMAPDKPFQTLLVTSAGPAEGKTTVACCIAIAMAQAGQTVAILDCDLRRPRIHRVFGLSSSSGLTTSLIDGDFEGVAMETEVPGLSVIPAGPIPPNPAELFHTERFAKFLDHVRSRYDRIIIDSPPVAAVTDPAVLSTLADGTVLVVRAFRTRKEVARHAARLLRGVGGVIAGVVLNAVDFTKTEYKYSYYYYRRDEYYRNEPADTGAAGDRISQPPAAPS
jgi:capsular exopolysaccharide synthesis family protein